MCRNLIYKNLPVAFILLPSLGTGPRCGVFQCSQFEPTQSSLLLYDCKNLCSQHLSQSMQACRRHPRLDTSAQPCHPDSTPLFLPIKLTSEAEEAGLGARRQLWVGELQLAQAQLGAQKPSSPSQAVPGSQPDCFARSFQGTGNATEQVLEGWVHNVCCPCQTAEPGASPRGLKRFYILASVLPSAFF